MNISEMVSLKSCSFVVLFSVQSRPFFFLEPGGHGKVNGVN